MLRVTAMTGKAGLKKQSDMEGIIADLGTKGYRAVIRSMYRDAYTSLDVPSPSEKDLSKILEEGSPYSPYRGEDPLGDLFLKDGLLYLMTCSGGSIVVAVVADGPKECELLPFCEAIGAGLKSRIRGKKANAVLQWSSASVIGQPLQRIPVRYRYRVVDSLIVPSELRASQTEFKMTRPEYSAEDAIAAQFLAENANRQFALKLAQVGKMRNKDASEIATDEMIARFRTLGLVVEEYLLTCRQDQHTICIVPSKEYLTREPTSLLRCNVCQRAFADEKLEPIYSLTVLGKRLLNKSLWMSIWLTELLLKLGINAGSIKWGAEANGEELDIVLEDFGSRVFFELKDREFGLGDAYTFTFRLTRYGGSAGVVATMDKMSADAKKFFAEEAERRDTPIDVMVFEAVAGIKAGMADLLHRMSLAQIERLLAPFSYGAGLNLWPVVGQWLRRYGQKGSRVS